MSELGARMRMYREALGISLSRAARDASLSKGYWSKLEAGAERPSLPTACRIADALGISLYDLAGWPEVPRTNPIIATPRPHPDADDPWGGEAT